MTQEVNEPATEWIRSTLDKALRDISDLGVISDELVEARPIWSIPGKVLIAQARQINEADAFVWIICGDLPTDTIGSSAASTPRDALRRFSMKWQMDAQRYNDPATRKAHGLSEDHDWNTMTSKLIAKAEELYAVAQDDRIWQ